MLRVEHPRWRPDQCGGTSRGPAPCVTPRWSGMRGGGAYPFQWKTRSIRL